MSPDPDITALAANGHQLHSHAGRDDVQRVALPRHHPGLRGGLLCVWVVALRPRRRPQRTLPLTLLILQQVLKAEQWLPSTTISWAFSCRR